MELNFTHINKKDWIKFQTIACKYFEELKKDKQNFPHILDVKTISHGSGPDEGMDLLVTLEFDDTIFKHKVTWVVQCKCYNKSVNLADLKGVNIPTLVHSCNAQGYLLICKNGVTSGVTKLFKELNEKCKMNYRYIIWVGDDFKQRIGTLNNSDGYLKTHFPRYYRFILKQRDAFNAKSKEIESIVK